MDTNRLYRLVLDAVKDPLVLARTEGAIVLTNAAADAFFGPSHAKSIATLACEQDGVVVDGEAVRELMTRHEAVRDLELCDASGNPCGATLNIEPVRPEGGEELRLLHFRKPSVQVDREFWRDEMIAMVSHEIKNPLSAMKQSLDILLSGGPGDLTEGQRRFLGTSGRSIQRLTQLVDGFLDISRIREGAFDVERRLIDMRDFVRDTVASFATLFNVRGVSIDWSVDQDASDAHVDAAKVEQVLVNLLSNALKHTPEGGSIKVSVETAGVEALDDDIRLLPWGDLGTPRLLRVRVRDTGLGMSTETLDRVFDRYCGQPGDEHRGSHLGLNISRALVEAQGGRIEIDSQIGIGTTATVYLPQNRATACLLTRVERARGVVERLERARLGATVVVLGKLTDDDWNDIARTWATVPAVNPEAGVRVGVPFQLWAVDSTLALGVIAGGATGGAVEEIFGSRFVTSDDGAYIFNGFAVGLSRPEGDVRGFSQLVNVATKRMVTARDVMSRAVDERRDADLAVVLNEWKRRPQAQ